MKNRRILVIDDDPKLCEFATAILQSEGFETVFAHDGLSGIEMARATPPALILLDMVMPGIDGITTCQRLKQDPALRHIPVVGVTSSWDRKYTEQIFRAGAELFLAKPFRPHSLIQMVNIAAEKVLRKPGEQGHPRFAAKLAVRGLVPAGGETTREVAGHTSNLSLDSLLLWLPEALPVGTLFRLEVGLPDGTASAEARVTWQDKAEDRLIPHGVDILHFVEDSEYLRYRRYLSHIAGGQAIS